VAIVTTMMAIHDVRRRPERAVLFAGGDVLRTVFDAEHAVDSTGQASDYGARNASNYRTSDLGATLEAVDHAAWDAIASPRADRYRHQADGRNRREVRISSRRFLVAVRAVTQALRSRPQRGATNKIANFDQFGTCRRVKPRLAAVLRPYQQSLLLPSEQDRNRRGGKPIAFGCARHGRHRALGKFFRNGQHLRPACNIRQAQSSPVLLPSTSVA
jgi:hypothetical protein